MQLLKSGFRKPCYNLSIGIPNLQRCDCAYCICSMVKLGLKEAKHWIFQFVSPSPNYQLRVQGKGTNCCRLVR